MYQYASSTDTTDKKILYRIPNNYNSTSGTVRVSNTAIFYNEDVTHNQPYLTVKGSTISDGFQGSSLVMLNGGNKFNGDTMVLNFHVDPLSAPPYDMQCVYIKQP